MARSAPSRRSGSMISLTPPTNSGLGLTPVRPSQSLRDPTPKRAATLAVITMRRDLPRISPPTGGAREVKTCAPSARASTLRAGVTEATRATRCMRFLVRGGPMPPVRKVPFRSRLGSALTFPRVIRTPAHVSTPWPSEPSWRKTAPSVRPASAPGFEGSDFPEASPCLRILPSTMAPPSQRIG